MRLYPFRLFGVYGTTDYDPLKCWVFFNQYVYGQVWPEGYKPQTPVEELLRDFNGSGEKKETIASHY